MLLLALLLSQTPQHQLFRQPNLPRDSYAQFEAFPASMAGTSGPCSTTAPTGARGEVLTFTRASAATCTKTQTGGLATTLIADGDLVALTSNQARVEFDSSGTLGLLVEAARTNICLRSEELDNAAWSGINSGVAAPTVTANAATAPDGTLTAERVQIPAVTVAQYSLRTQTVTLAATSTRGSLYVRGNGTSGTVCFALDNGTADNVLCSYVSTSWSRCVLPSVINGAHPIYIGNYGIAAGNCTGSALAQDIFVWGVQIETTGATYATSYIPTTSAAVTRAVEEPSFAGVAWPTSTSISMSGTFYGPTPVSAGAATVGEFTGLASLFNENGGLMRWYTGGLGQTVAIAASTSGLRWYGWHDGATRGMAWGGNAAGPTADVDSNNKFGATYYPGGSGGFRPNGIVSRICIDPDPARCR